MKKISCQEVLDQLWEYLDDEARAELCTEIDSHINGCPHCRIEVDSLKQTISLYRAEDGPGTPIHLSQRLQLALEQVYREKDGTQD